LAGRPMFEIFAAAMGGRLIKYLLLAWVSTHAPAVLGKLWGFKSDLEEVGVNASPDGHVTVEVPPPHPKAHLPGRQK